MESWLRRHRACPQPAVFSLGLLPAGGGQGPLGQACRPPFSLHHRGLTATATRWLLLVPAEEVVQLVDGALD